MGDLTVNWRRCRCRHSENDDIVLRMILIPKRWRMMPVVIAAGMTSVLVVGCASPTASDGEEQLSPILATTSIWADITSEVLCGEAVPSLIPIGSDPHTWEPSMATRADVDASLAIITNGLGLESGLDDIFDSARANGIQVVELTAVVELLPTLAAHDGDDEGDQSEDEHSEDEHSHSESGLDPHIWLDPQRVIDTIPTIVEMAIESGFDRNEIEVCGEEYSNSLRELDTEINNLFESLTDSDRTIVTNHDSLGYFADRYDLTVIGTVLPSTDTSTEANAADLAALADLITSNEVTTIFTDSESSDTDSQALAERLDIDVVPLLTSSLTSGSESGRSYIELMRTNANAIHSALQHSGQP